jgi:hypothetical protein
MTVNFRQTPNVKQVLGRSDLMSLIKPLIICNLVPTHDSSLLQGANQKLDTVACATTRKWLRFLLHPAFQRLRQLTLRCFVALCYKVIRDRVPQRDTYSLIIPTLENKRLQTNKKYLTINTVINLNTLRCF